MIRLAESQDAALAVKFLTDSFLAERTRCLGIIDRYGDLIWLIQPIHDSAEDGSDPYARTVKFLEGQFELIQRATADSLGMNFAVTICADPSEWRQLSAVHDRIRNQQHKRGGDGAQLVQTIHMETIETAAQSRLLKEKTELLAVHLEGEEESSFYSCWMS
ncbi:hypothetical protein [Paenibacillus hexagrammi]|uniref:Uncharacterized protein n=1 Tax=Paenibacillus hexagrammi TaxID=2908839 RepID=A0ABY3SE64_9BACL|nr:hypothetical protein [Paenibacillus sp. YPD9-1]UJF31405.1 hypothetical protein L0M14_16365 [Paenibacillus sp. YPD9-1]